MVDIDALRTRLLGKPFPGGPFTVAPYERWLAHDAMQSPALPTDVLHPVWVFLCGIRGMGFDLGELLRLAEVDFDAGVMWGEVTLEQHAPLRPDLQYEIRGEIVDVARCRGKRAGTFDTVTFQLDVLGESGECVGSSKNSFLFVRA